MNKQAQKEKQAWKKDVAVAIKLLEVGKRFIDEHLAIEEFAPLILQKIFGSIIFIIGIRLVVRIIS